MGEFFQRVNDRLGEWIDFLNGYVWAWPKEPWPPLLVVLLVGTGAFITFRLGWIQVRKFRHGVRVIRGIYDDPEDEGDINHFQALTSALSATVGIGNIAGVATAIHYGGPGALFWMWVTAVFGMSLKYTECSLSHRFRVIHPDGSASGGPMYYIEKGLGSRWRWLAVAFAVCAVISSFGSGNMVQAFTVADSFRSDFSIPPLITGLVTATLVGLVIVGGIRRIGAVTSKLVPFMAVIYVAGATVILLLNVREIPEAVVLIFRSAFRPEAGVGGAVSGFIFTLLWGVKRGLFSNESGQGSAPIAHAAAKTKESIREGTVAMLGPFIDTLVICTMTGLVIITTGVWKDKLYEELEVTAQSDVTVVVEGAAIQPGGKVADEDLSDGTILSSTGRATGVDFVRNHALVESPHLESPLGVPFSGRLDVSGGVLDVSALEEPLWLTGEMAQNGSPLTSWGFERGLGPFGDWGGLIVTISVFLFAISTAISWSYYGDRAVEYLAGPRWIPVYRWVFLGFHFLGANVALEWAWGFGDTALGLMTIPNLISILALSGLAARMTREYFSREHVPYPKGRRR
jgi:AGCS family alanine or glycine:cation symporter